MAEELSKKTGLAFRAITAVFFVLVMATLIFGLMHRSEQPQILNRYSHAYALFLAVLSVVALYLGWVLWKAGPRAVRWTANIYALLISTVIMLVLVEWGMRLFNPFGVNLFHDLPYHMQGMVDDPLLGYKHPDSVDYMLGGNRIRINSQGLRDQEIPLVKPDDEKRILVLGDSVVFGWGVSQGESFSDRMEPLLHERTGHQWQVINTGVNGYNTEQEAMFLRTEGLRYSPDYVLLVYVSNDVEPVLDPNSTTWRRYPSWPSSLPEALDRLRQTSFLFQLTKLFTRMHRMDLARQAGMDNNSDATAPVSKSVIDHPNWPKSRAALLDIARQCKNAHIPLLVAVDSGFDSESIAGLKNLGLDAIHLHPASNGLSIKQAYVSRIDPHPSAMLHQNIAAYLVDAMQQRGWLEDE
jgi:lysophospholipase L1-like esterase